MYKPNMGSQLGQRESPIWLVGNYIMFVPGHYFLYFSLCDTHTHRHLSFRIHRPLTWCMFFYRGPHGPPTTMFYWTRLVSQLMISRTLYILCLMCKYFFYEQNLSCLKYVEQFCYYHSSWYILNAGTRGAPLRFL